MILQEFDLFDQVMATFSFRALKPDNYLETIQL